MWIPDTKGVYPDLLATSGDYLRIWRVRYANHADTSVTYNQTLVMIDCTSRQHQMKMHINARPWSYCEHSSMHNTLESHFILSDSIYYVLSFKLII